MTRDELESASLELDDEQLERYKKMRKGGMGHNLSIMCCLGEAPAGVVKNSNNPTPKRGKGEIR